MTANEFNTECVARTLDPAIAIENPDIRAALRDRDDDRVCELLDTEF
jgi:hypothetical protein